ncbi:MAG: GerMN domain-containing protein [Chloroflexales bacterium]|nr:GerMN domain-containing protein [Chloroflexales bacterium]
MPYGHPNAGGGAELPRAGSRGLQVALQGLTISDGVATAYFSPALKAYGGDALRAQLIREQITRTLLQFPEVHTVRIGIDGQTEGVLEP